jgi:isopentenyl-diphosphate delta-isomerase
MSEQHIILVDHDDREIGTMEKMEVHRRGLLHRAFSVFIFSSKGEVLVQQRADSKYHSGSLWSNACCSHPLAGEDLEAAAARRLKEELGFETPLEKIFHFTYRASLADGLTEHEFDHVFAGIYEGPVPYNRSEVQAVEFVPIEELQSRVLNFPGQYTAWFPLALPEAIRWWRSIDPGPSA